MRVLYKRALKFIKRTGNINDMQSYIGLLCFFTTFYFAEKMNKFLIY